MILHNTINIKSILGKIFNDGVFSEKLVQNYVLSFDSAVNNLYVNIYINILTYNLKFNKMYKKHSKMQWKIAKGEIPYLFTSLCTVHFCYVCFSKSFQPIITDIFIFILNNKQEQAFPYILTEHGCKAASLTP